MLTDIVIRLGTKYRSDADGWFVDVVGVSPTHVWFHMETPAYSWHGSISSTTCWHIDTFVQNYTRL